MPALTDTQKNDVRRHLGYGPIGDDPLAGTFNNWRFFQQAGLLEYRMNHMSTTEIITIIGTGIPGSPANPNFIDPGNNQLVEGLLNICNYLENQIPLAIDNFDIDKAGDYTARKSEATLRTRMYGLWCTKLAMFFRVPIDRANPGYPDASVLLS